jgi:anti-anti-sigma factor
MDVPPPHHFGGLGTRAPPVVFELPVPGLLVARVRGKLDADGAEELHRRVQDELLHRQPRRLVIELIHVRFLGLHGIAVLERLRRHATGHGHEVTLGAMSPAVERVLRIAGVLGRFQRAATTRPS